jgi:predicted nucleic acid-binding protein
VTVLVDTNVLIDIVQDDPAWADWSISQLRAQSQVHALVINPVVYAELSLSFASIEALDRTVSALQLELHKVPHPALFLAGKAFGQYRRRGGVRTQVLPDFIIGAHAAVMGFTLLTRDAARFTTSFPGLQVVSP